jgi:hypothetical protein
METGRPRHSNPVSGHERAVEYSEMLSLGVKVPSTLRPERHSAGALLQWATITFPEFAPGVVVDVEPNLTTL